MSNRFTMYHTTPASRGPDILKHGLEPRQSPHKTMWTPAEKVVYLTSSVDIAKNYANQAYKMRKTNARAWVIFKIEYDEFLEEVYQDLDWGIDGVYYVKVWIPPEHIEYYMQYFVHPAPRRVKKRD